MSTAEPLPTFRIRDMIEADLDAVLAIEDRSFSAPWSRSSFLNLLGRSDADLWVAERDGTVTGYAVAWHVADETELGNLAVAPAWRGRGLGTRLLEEVLERTRSRGSRRIFLEVRASNRAARSLYEKHGFAPVGVRPRYYREPVEDARVMCLELEQGG